MNNFQDLTGQKIGRLTILERAESKIDYRGKPITCWKCQCECGKIIIVRKTNLTSKNSLSCGCVRIDNLKNKKFGKLTVIKMHEDKSKGIKWVCKCDCGNETIVYSNFLKSGHTKSCGCLQKEVVSNIFRTHNLSKTKLYKRWEDMKNRCYTKTQTMYKYYGAKGIKICEEWLDKENGLNNFYNWSMKNGYRDNLTIDRIDSKGNYTPDNCRWVDRFVQNNNTSRNHLVTYNNETHSLAQWEKILGINQHTLLKRIREKFPKELLFYKGKITSKIRKEYENGKIK